MFYHLKKDKGPSITNGNIINCNPAVVYTNCPIINGASGGALVRFNGELLGIIVSHATQMSDDGSTKIVYTRFNMSIPIMAVSKPIRKYLETKGSFNTIWWNWVLISFFVADVHVLESLNCRRKEILNLWNIFQSKL